MGVFFRAERTEQICQISADTRFDQTSWAAVLLLRSGTDFFSGMFVDLFVDLLVCQRVASANSFLMVQHSTIYISCMHVLTSQWSFIPSPC